MESANQNQSLPTSINIDPETFRMYYVLQYERIDKLEQQKLWMTGVVLAISAFSYSLAFSDASETSIIKVFIVPLVVLVCNVFAELYLRKTRAFIKLHQDRAKKARQLCAPGLEQLQKSIEKPDSNNDLLNRTHIQQGIHRLLALCALVTPAIIYLEKSTWNLTK